MNSTTPLLFMKEDFDPFDLDNSDITSASSNTDESTDESHSRLFSLLRRRVRQFNRELGRLTFVRENQQGNWQEFETQDNWGSLSMLGLSSEPNPFSDSNLTLESESCQGIDRWFKSLEQGGYGTLYKKNNKEEEEKIYQLYVRAAGAEYFQVYLRDEFQVLDVKYPFELVFDQYSTPAQSVQPTIRNQEFPFRYYRLVRNRQFIDPVILKMFDDCDFKKSGIAYLRKELFVVKPYYFRFNESTTEHIHKMRHKTTLSKIRIPNGHGADSEYLNLVISSDPDRYGYYEWVQLTPETSYQPIVRGESYNRHPLEAHVGLCPFCAFPCILQLMNGAYKKHLVVEHGIFLNGMEVEDPEYSISDNCFVCPYGECRHQRLAKGSGNRKDRFKFYLKHVYEVHDSFKDDFWRS